MAGCKKCAVRKEEIDDLRWEVKDLECEIYTMKKTPCGNESCKMIAHHSDKCYWMNPTEDEMKVKLQKANNGIELLINHINVHHLYLHSKINELDLKGVWNIGNVKAGKCYGEIEYI